MFEGSSNEKRVRETVQRQRDDHQTRGTIVKIEDTPVSVSRRRGIDKYPHSSRG